MNNVLDKQYDKIAQGFEAVFEKGAQHNRHEFRKLVPSVKNKIVLDIGCGDGSDCLFCKTQGAAWLLELMLLKNY